MPTRGVLSAALTAVLTLAVSFDVRAEAPERTGGEFQVNTYTTSVQRYANVAVESDGDFIVVWGSEGQDGVPGLGIFGQRFSASGVARGVEFRVNTYTQDYQTARGVAVDGSGRFVVIWQSFSQDGNEYGMFARRFDAAGLPQAVEFQVNAYTLGRQEYGSIAMRGDGSFVVAWMSGGQDGNGNGVFARRFDSLGTPLATEIQVSTNTVGEQRYPDTAIDANGTFVIAWQEGGGVDGNSNGIFARRFDASGVALANQFQVNTYTPAGQNLPSVAMAPSGDFVIAWDSHSQDGSGFGIFAQQFDADGTPLGGELQVNEYTEAYQQYAVAAMESDGDFIVTWAGAGDQDGSSTGVFARIYSSSGATLEPEFQVSTYTMDRQTKPTVAANASGKFVFAWPSNGQDGSLDGVFAQRFGKKAVLDVDGNGTTEALTDGILILRYLFGFSGATLVGGAVDLDGCTRCDAASIAEYLATLV